MYIWQWQKKQSLTIAGKDMVAELEDLSEGLEADKWVMAAETEGHNAKEGTYDTKGLVAEMVPKEHIHPVWLVGMTTCYVGHAVAMVTGGSTEAFTSDCKWLFRSLSSCSRSLMWLCSFVSAASALQ